MKWPSLLFLAGMHAVASYALQIPFLLYGLATNGHPGEPRRGWLAVGDALVMAVWGLMFYPSLALQALGIDLWVWGLSPVVVVPNTLIWSAIVSLAVSGARGVLRSRRPSPGSGG